MGKVSNVITMMELLNNGRKYSISELSKLLEVTPRMVRIYKEELEKAGIYVDTQRGPYGGYILNNQVHLPHHNEEKTTMSAHDQSIYNIVNEALDHHQKLEIVYTSHGEKTIRVIHPLNLYTYDHCWYVPAFCELRNDMRHFEFENISEIKILNEFYE